MDRSALHARWKPELDGNGEALRSRTLRLRLCPRRRRSPLVDPDGGPRSRESRHARRTKVRALRGRVGPADPRSDGVERGFYNRLPIALGGCQSGQMERTVNPPAKPTQVRILLPPLTQAA